MRSNSCDNLPDLPKGGKRNGVDAPLMLLNVPGLDLDARLQGGVSSKNGTGLMELQRVRLPVATGAWVGTSDGLLLVAWGRLSLCVRAAYAGKRLIAGT